MDVVQALNRLKKEYAGNVKQADLAQGEKLYTQINNTIKSDDEHLPKTLGEVEKAKSKIIELSDSLREVNFKNEEISREMTHLEERLISADRENWKHKQNSEGNKERMDVLEAENKVLLCNFIEQEEENRKLRKKLTQLNSDLKDVSSFADKFLESDKMFQKIMGRVREKQNEVGELQKAVLHEERLVKISKEIEVLTAFYEDKLKTLESDKKILLTELGDLKVELNILEDSITENPSEASLLLSTMVTLQCRKSRDILKENIEDQEFRLKRLEELLQREMAANSKLKTLSDRRKRENEELQKTNKNMHVEVKDEIVFLENSDESGVIE